MLFILTGNVQTGKTRWLQNLVEALENHGTEVLGVIAPGVWHEHPAPDQGVTYEKLGIDNVLLPQRTTIPFARRADLILPDEMQTRCAQAQNAQLAWAIDDDAIRRVDEHLAWVRDVTADREGDAYGEYGRRGGRGANTPLHASLLVIDELGRLELLGDAGLRNGVALVEQGATARLRNALIVVRDELLSTARARFAQAPWGAVAEISPDEESRRLVLETLASE